VAGKEIARILATDCGSTTTKAILIEKRDGEYRLIRRGEAPTTVEAPAEDVTKGVLNAVAEIEDLEGRKFLKADGEGIEISPDGKGGVDIYMSTSSAGGGLQMTVAGVVKTMTGESAQRAALGAGAIVMDVVASNDGRLPHEKVADIRRLRPDMILLSGGIDGGTIDHVVELAEIIRAADPKPRFGVGYKLPVIFAGNKDAREAVKEALGDRVELKIVDNLRPVLEKENLGPARDIIHELFMEHVMAQAPGYPKLMEWAGYYDEKGRWKQVPIMPTPGAVGKLIETVAKNEGIEVMGVDIGGATTDVFSVFKDGAGEPVFNRTVSANLGMSYSVSNVLASAGFDNVMRWVPFHMDEADLRNRIRNKMIRPTTIPQMLKELIVEQAIAREALRLALVQHKELATGLKGVAQERTIGDAFEQTQTGSTLVNMMSLDLLIGSGGVLSHAPRRSQAALMLIDSFLPEGITKLAVDSIFMMPQLGVLSEVHPKAATEVFDKDCLIRLGTCVAPSGENRKADVLAEVEYTSPDGTVKKIRVERGKMHVEPLGVGEKVDAVIRPARGLDVGAGPGDEWMGTLEGGVVGLIFDGRGRKPFDLPEKDATRIEKLQEWAMALEIYPDRFIHLEEEE